MNLIDVNFSLNILSSSGPFLRKNGEQSVKLYPLNLFNVKVGDKLGIWKASDRTLHFHLNGNDQGIASSNLPEGKNTICMGILLKLIININIRRFLLCSTFSALYEKSTCTEQC